MTNVRNFIRGEWISKREGRTIAADGGYDDTVRAAQEFCLYDAAAAWSCRFNHALEFPGLHTGMEDRSCFGCGEYRHIQTILDDSSHCGGTCRDLRAVRCSAWSIEPPGRW